MAFTNYDTQEINCKIVYVGSRGSGKTENLRSIFKTTSKEIQAGLLELESDYSSTKFFDFLPVSIGHFQDYHIKLHLYTLPPIALYQTVASVILKGIDGFVFVANSQIEAMVDNINAMMDIKRVLGEEGYNVNELPRVIQYNRRDLSDVVPVELMRREFNLTETIDQEAVASENKGTLETLLAMAQLVIKRLSTTE